MKNIADFEPFILPYAPYTPTEVLQYAIREAVVEFMRETKIAVDTIEIETQDKVSDYLLDIPECRRWLGVKKAERGYTNCNGVTHWERIKGGEYGDYEVHLRSGEQPYLVLSDAVRKSYTIKIDYYWAISRDDCEVPDYIYEDFMNPIISGAILRLANMPNHENLLRLVQAHQIIWFDGIQKAKVEKTGGKAKLMIGAPILSRRGGFRWR